MAGAGPAAALPTGYRHEGEEVVVDEKWAEVVRMIFREYLKPDASIRSVAEILNTKGIVTTRGNKWSITAVRDVLANRKYTGAFVRFKDRVGKYHAIQDGEIVERRKSDSPEKPEPMIREDSHEAIIDKRTFAGRKPSWPRIRESAHRNGYQYAFTGLLRCGDCGGPMNGRPSHNGSGITRRRYECNAYHIKGASVCHANGIAEEELMGVVVSKLQDHVFSESAIEKLLSLYRKRWRPGGSPSPSMTAGSASGLTRSTARSTKGPNGFSPLPEKLVSTIYAKLDKLRVERDRLQAQLEATGQAETGSNALDDQKVEEAARVLRDMREAFQDAEPEEIRELLAPLVAKVELHFDHERHGKLERNPFKHGTIFVRPTEPQLSLLLQIAETS